MTKEMKYQSRNNSYTVTKKGKPAYSTTGFFVCVVLPLIVVFLITVSLFMRSISFNTIVDGLSYNEMANVTYKVKIKENENYSDTILNSGMNYPSSLIETVNPTFSYEFHSPDTLDLEYSYTIASKYVVLDFTDEKTPLTNDEDNVVELAKDKQKLTGSSININESVAIDFQKYKDKANNFKQDLRIAATAKVYVYMNLHVTGTKEGMDKKYERDILQEIEIPLTDATTSIKKNSNNINKQDFLVSTKKFTIKSIPMFIAFVILIEVVIYLFLRFIKEYKRFKTKDLYTSLVSKILKDYDRVIVRGKLDIDESKYTNIIYPETFEQLVDASINEGSPILYYNVIPGQKCFFVIIEGDTLYKYRITRWYVDQNGHA